MKSLMILILCRSICLLLHTIANLITANCLLLAYSLWVNIFLFNDYIWLVKWNRLSFLNFIAWVSICTGIVEQRCRWLLLSASSLYRVIGLITLHCVIAGCRYNGGGLLVVATLLKRTKNLRSLLWRAMESWTASSLRARYLIVSEPVLLLQ